MVRIVFHCLLVHRVEVEAGVIGLDGLEERSEGILDATPIQRSVMQTMYSVENGPFRVDLQLWGLLFCLFIPFGALHKSSQALGFSRRTGGIVLVE